MRVTAIMALLLGAALGACSSGGDGGESAGDRSSEGPPAGASTGIDSASAVFVLGDSLSDVGNAAAAADSLLGKPVSPPTVGLCNPADVLVVPRPCDDLFYRKSRVSNGPVAVEYVAQHFGLGELAPSLHLEPNRPARGTDYAVAGAKARTERATDLTAQVDALLLDHRPLPADALYVVMIGGNDAIDALQTAASGGPTAAQASADVVAAAVDAIGANVERLLDFGARRIVVANVPDLATLPDARATAAASSDEAGLLATASAISAAFDERLSALIDALAARAIWNAPTAPVLVRFDLRAAWIAVQAATLAHGGDAADACFDSDRYRASATAERVFAPDCAPAAGEQPKFDRFVFWDGIHPTGAAHSALGAALIAAL